MAEFCRRCFIKNFRPHKEDIVNIVMSEDVDVCEGCGELTLFVDHIRDT